MMRNIVLVGFMGTGKNVVGKVLAQRLGIRFVDMDQMIEEIEGRSIAQIFEKNGEPYFRKIEKQVAKEVSEYEGVVIAAGGGVVLDQENVDNLKKNGLMICLSAKPGVILERTKGYIHRPLLNVEDPGKRVAELLEDRAPFYAKAHYQIDTSSLSVDEVVQKVLELIKNK